MNDIGLNDHFDNQTRLTYTGEQSPLTDALSADCVEEMRSLEIEREHNAGAERWQWLRRGEPSRDVMLAHARVDKRLITQRLDEVEARCRGSRGNPWACDY